VLTQHQGVPLLTFLKDVWYSDKEIKGNRSARSGRSKVKKEIMPISTGNFSNLMVPTLSF